MNIHKPNKNKTIKQQQNERSGAQSESRVVSVYTEGLVILIPKALLSPLALSVSFLPFPYDLAALSLLSAVSSFLL